MSVSKIKKYRRKTKEKQRNDVVDLFTSEDMENIYFTLIPDIVSYGKYELSIFR